MVFLKLVHTESHVNLKTQPFWVKAVHLVPNVQTLAGHAIGTIGLAPSTTLHFDRVLKTKCTKSLVNTNSFNTNFTNTHFQKVPIPHLTRTMKQKFLH